MNKKYIILSSIIFLMFSCIYWTIFTLKISSFVSFILLTLIYIVFYILFNKNKLFLTLPKTSIAKVLIYMNIIFIVFDIIVFNNDKLSLPLILYMPILFTIFCFMLFVYKKSFVFNSFSSLLLFFNIYLLSTSVLVLNHLQFNSFYIVILIHLMFFITASFFFYINSSNNKENYNFINYNYFYLLLLNILILFISLNRIIFKDAPVIFIDYLYFVSSLIIIFVTRAIYKNFAKF